MSNGNEHGPENLMLRTLRDIDRKVDRLSEQIVDLTLRVSAQGQGLTLVNSRVEGLSARVDRIDARLDRIERRLELHEHT